MKIVMTSSATAARGESPSVQAPRERAMMGSLAAAAGTNRPRYAAKAMAAAAIAPENPATNDVQPERNPARGPKASLI